ncbi:MAG: LPXTG cell wall anchor domain-containing protein, partial [Negativicutes bacterium]|nr:LPXTG cell wall anchor domain-containing protein [Negativicutes bacterium]
SIIFFYKLSDESYTINYHLPSGTVSKSGTNVFGTSISADLTKTPAGFHISAVTYNNGTDITADGQGNYAMSLNDGDNVMDVYYLADNENYVINYHLPSGTVSSSGSAAYGASVAADLATNQTPNGYHISKVTYNDGSKLSTIAGVDGAYSMSIGEASNIMDVYYAPNTETYTVNYYVLGSETTVPGLPVSATTSGSGDFGSKVTITPPDVTGYTYDSADNNPATLGEDGNVITIYYTKNIPVPPTPTSVDITIHYYLTGTTKSLKADKIDAGTAGKAKTETAPAISGYIALKASQTFTVQESNNVITFYYKKVANNNTPKGNPDTGDSGMSLPLAAAMTVLAAAGAAIIGKRKHAK